MEIAAMSECGTHPIVYLIPPFLPPLAFQYSVLSFPVEQQQ
jgi:hypothetical protein